MGKWNFRPSHRFFSRRRSPERPSKFYNIKAPLPEFRHDGIPLWEKKYCTLSGCVAWQKIVDSKELIYCHHNVLDWKDSGAEEAFQNAKKRYWAKMKNIPCDISLPDPDAFIENIDWNPCIDPELIKELENAFVAIPDEEEQENAKKFKRTKISVDGEDPWECAAKSLGRPLENNKVQGQNQGVYHDNSENVITTDNPWQSSVFHGNRTLTDNAWEGGHDKSGGWNEEFHGNRTLTDNAWEGGHDKSGGWNEGRDHNNQCGDWNSGCSPKDKGWGKARDSSWCQQQSNNWANIGNGEWNSGCSPKDKGWGNTRDSSWCQQQSNNWANTGNSWEYKSSKQNVIPMNTGWGNSGPNVSRWKQQEKAYVSSDSQFRRNNGGGWTGGNQSYQMREGSNRHNLGYNGSQLQRGDSQTGHYWKRDQSRKRGFRA